MDRDRDHHVRQLERQNHELRQELVKARTRESIVRRQHDQQREQLSGFSEEETELSFTTLASLLTTTRGEN
jgi:hypothetical protein